MSKDDSVYLKHIMESILQPEIPWKLMAGMRDVLIHEYFGVDLDELWDTAVNDLPELKKQIANNIKL